MTLLQAAISFAMGLMNQTNNGFPYDHQIVEEVVAAVVDLTTDLSEVETLIRIARWESGGFRADVAHCKTRGDEGHALGIWQVHPWSNKEAAELCGTFKQQAAIALARVKESYRMCRGYSGGDRLGGYTTGHCFKNNVAGRLRWGDGSTIAKIMENNK
jgi:hypothetical protein